MYPLDLTWKLSNKATFIILSPPNHRKLDQPSQFSTSKVQTKKNSPISQLFSSFFFAVFFFAVFYFFFFVVFFSFALFLCFAFSTLFIGIIPFRILLLDVFSAFNFSFFKHFFLIRLLHVAFLVGVDDTFDPVWYLIDLSMRFTPLIQRLQMMHSWTTAQPRKLYWTTLHGCNRSMAAFSSVCLSFCLSDRGCI